MISALQCREFGFGLKMSAEEIAAVNFYREQRIYRQGSSKGKARQQQKGTTHLKPICDQIRI
jgi:hypothetical protein